MRNTLTFLITLLLFYSFSAYANPEVMQIEHSSKTVYLAKSGLNCEDTWDIRWSRDYAIAGAAVVYSEEKWDDTDSSFEGNVLSIVGPYISYKAVSDGYRRGAAHPWHTKCFATIDMRNGKKVKLTDIFDETQIYKALLNDSIVKKALNGKLPKNLKELLEQADGGCEFSIDESSFESFVFHHIKGNKVAVRLGLPHGCEAMRGNFTQLGFYLTIPSDLKVFFDAAKKKNLLMNQMVKLKYK